MRNLHEDLCMIMTIYPWIFLRIINISGEFRRGNQTT